MHGLAPRLAGGLAAFLGLLTLYEVARGSVGGNVPLAAVVGFAFALGGSWIAGLHRLFPRMDPFRALAAGWRRAAAVLEQAGYQVDEVVAGAVTAALGTLLLALVWTARHESDGEPIVAVLAATVFIAAGLLLLAHGLRVGGPRWAGVIGAVAIAGFVSLFAAAILAVAWFATPVAWLGAVLLAAAACWLWWEALRQLRGALQAPSPPPPAEEGGPVGPV